MFQSARLGYYDNTSLLVLPVEAYHRHTASHATVAPRMMAPRTMASAAEQVAAIASARLESSAPFGSVAGLEEGVLLAACGETDNEAQTARLSELSGHFMLRASSVTSSSKSLHKRRLSEGSYQAMLERTICELDEHSHTTR